MRTLTTARAGARSASWLPVLMAVLTVGALLSAPSPTAAATIRDVRLEAGPQSGKSYAPTPSKPESGRPASGPPAAATPDAKKPSSAKKRRGKDAKPGKDDTSS